MIRPLLFIIAALAAMSLPAQAFDCAKAGTVTEKLICSDAALKAADDAMGAAWKRLGDLLDKNEMQAMRASQRAWPKLRDDRCGYGEDAERVQCLKTATAERTLILSGEPRTGPGTGNRLVPLRFIAPAARKPTRWTLPGCALPIRRRPASWRSTAWWTTASTHRR